MAKKLPDIIVKQVTPKKLKFTDLTVKETYELEVKVLSRLKGSTFFPQLLTSDDDSLQITMSYAGKSLNRIAKKHPTGKLINVDQFNSIKKQILIITKILESKKVVHLDLRPSNICIADNYQLRLIDFGLAVIDNDPYKENLENRYNKFLKTGGYENFSKVFYDLVFSVLVLHSH